MNVHWMKLRLDESVKIGWKCFGWKCHRMKTFLDESVSGWKRFWMKVCSTAFVKPVGGGTSFKSKGLRRCLQPRKHSQSGCVRNIWNSGMRWRSGIHQWWRSWVISLPHWLRKCKLCPGPFPWWRIQWSENSAWEVQEEEARYGVRASRVGEASHPGPRSDTHRSSQHQRSRRVPEDVLDALQFDLTQDDSDSNAQVNQRRHSPPHIQQGLAAVGKSQMSTVPVCSHEVRVSHARVFGRPTSTNGSEVATERDPVDPTSRDGTVYRPTLQTHLNQWSPHDRGDDWCCCKNQGVHRVHEMWAGRTRRVSTGFQRVMVRSKTQRRHQHHLQFLWICVAWTSQRSIWRKFSREEQQSWGLCRSFTRGVSEAHWGLQSKKKQQVEYLEMRSGEPELGICSCCLARSSTNLHEEVWSPGRSWERFAAFAVGKWAELFRASRETGVQASAQTVRRRCRKFTDDLSRRAQRAVSFVQMGELSAARRALEGAQLAPGTSATLAGLDRRPSAPRESMGKGSRNTSLSNVSDKELFLINLRTARRGAVRQAWHPTTFFRCWKVDVIRRSQSLHSRWSGGCSSSGFENPGF